MNEAPIKIAIIGAGFIAGKHTAILKERSDVRIAAVIDTAPGAASEFIGKQELSGAEAYEDLEIFLKQGAADAAYVCLPPFAHDGQVEALASKGMHVFVEKPIALDSKRAQSMVDAVERSGVRSQVGFHLRFMKGVRALRERIDSGAAGRPLLFDGRYWANFPGKGWWRDLERSGGQVFEQVCHIYDTARYFLGKPERVHGAIARLGHGDERDYTVEDTSASIITFENGSMASVTGSNCALPMRFIGDFRIVCERAILDFHSEGDWRVKERATLTLHDGEEIQERIEIVEDSDPFIAETEDFIAAVKSGGKTLTPIREGLETIRMIERVRDEAPMVVANA